MKNYIQPGELLDYPNASGATIASGTGVLIGVRLGVAAGDIAIGATGQLRVKGVVSLPKLSTDTPAQGAALYWDNTNKRLTTTTTSNTLAGYAANAAASGDTTVNIALNS
jgi:predicted RecA/RadA family phage recombinase